MIRKVTILIYPKCFVKKSIDDLVAFLHALSDPCVTDRACMKPWLLEDDEAQDPNGDQVNAIDQSGETI